MSELVEAIYFLADVVAAAGIVVSMLLFAILLTKACSKGD